MTIHLSDECDEIARFLMRYGRFASSDEVIDTALRLLQKHGEQARLADPRREVAIGIEEADRGELDPFDPHATLERIRACRASTATQS